MTKTEKAAIAKNHGQSGRKKQRNSEPALSLFALLAKDSFCKILAATAVMTFTESALFYWALQNHPGSTFESLIEDSRIPALFLAAFGTVYFILTWTQSTQNDKSRDTLLRLRLSYRQLFLIKTVWNFLCLILLFALQIWLMIGMLECFVRESGLVSASSRQLFLAAYRSEFFHCLLPMADIRKWVRNLLLLLALAAEASFSIRQKNYVLFALLPAITVLWFISPIGANLTDAACCALYAFGIAVSVRKAGRLTADNF